MSSPTPVVRRRRLAPSLSEVLLGLAGALATTTLIAGAAAAAALRAEKTGRRGARRDV
ncbi:hypothetical protein [Nonomuraea sp. SYSU D8015]|uniref:hypothetical protein n=1 Tax=Nonomuraea sp. SYSU D8015 TaxID=2593644 RepID=UPI0016609D75|nr:hypothetical protein [Nonomuraea sp. SYSU D8015]